MGNTTHRKNKMKENGGNVKDYRVWVLTGFRQSSLSSILFLRANVLASTRDDTPSLLKILLT